LLSSLQIIAKLFEFGQVVSNLLFVALFAVVQLGFFVFFFVLENKEGGNNDFVSDGYERFLLASACN